VPNDLRTALSVTAAIGWDCDGLEVAGSLRATGFR
jgi:hypothetical protein